MVMRMISSLPPGWQIEERCADGAELRVIHRADQDEKNCHE
jgi:hypothetical protein